MGPDRFRIQPSFPQAATHASKRNTHHLVGEHADIDLVVDAAVGLEDEVAGRLHELFGTVAKEEVAQQHLAVARMYERGRDERSEPIRDTELACIT